MIINDENIEFDEFSRRILDGVNKAVRKLVEAAAARDESLITGDENGKGKSIPAKELLKRFTEK